MKRVRVGWVCAVVVTAACAGESAQPTPSKQEAPAKAEPAPAAAPAPAKQEIPAHVHPADWPGTSNVTTSGRYFFAGQPDPAGLAHAAKLGVTTVINLRSEPEMASLGFDEPAEVRKLGMTYVAIPMVPDTFSREDVTRFAEALKASGDRKVLVHCASSNRVGGLWAAYLNLDLGVEFEQALDHGRWAGLRRPSMEDAAARVCGAND